MTWLGAAPKKSSRLNFNIRGIGPSSTGADQFVIDALDEGRDVGGAFLAIGPKKVAEQELIEQEYLPSVRGNTIVSIINHVGVNNEYRGMGYGSEIIAEIERFSKKMKAKYILGQIDGENNDLLGEWYQRLGFETVETYPMNWFWKKL